MVAHLHTLHTRTHTEKDTMKRSSHTAQPKQYRYTNLSYMIYTSSLSYTSDVRC